MIDNFFMNDASSAVKKVVSWMASNLANYELYLNSVESTSYFEF